jgi:hypothetical protein
VTESRTVAHYRDVFDRSCVLALLLGCIACNGALITDLSDGSRLHQLRWSYDEGGSEREREQYLDSYLGERCLPKRWSDGATYCMPDAAPAIFTDAHCTKALAAMGSGPRVSFAYRQYTVGTHTLPSRLFQIGSRTSPPAERWELRDDFCYGPFTPDTSASYFELDDAVDLVRIRYTTTFDADGFRIESATSDDGLLAPERIFDTSLGVSCEVAANANEPVTTCKPIRVPPVSLYTDASCTRLGVAAPERPPVASIHDEVSACDRYFLVGDQVPALYSAGPNTCAEVSPAGTYYAITNELALPAIERRAEGGNGLQTIRVGGLPLEDPLLHDSARELDCRGETIDGERYCLPAGTSAVEHLFTDSLCESPIAIAMVPTGSCARPGRFARDQHTFHEVLEPTTSLLFEYVGGGGCRLYRPTGMFQPHLVGPPTPHTSFAHATPLAAP